MYYFVQFIHNQNNFFSPLFTDMNRNDRKLKHGSWEWKIVPKGWHMRPRPHNLILWTFLFLKRNKKSKRLVDCLLLGPFICDDDFRHSFIILTWFNFFFFCGRFKFSLINFIYSFILLIFSNHFHIISLHLSSFHVMIHEILINDVVFLLLKSSLP